MGLKELQKKWEAGSELVAEFTLAGTVQRIVKRTDEYAWLRYFTIAGAWAVSVDYEDEEPDEIIDQLADLLGDPESACDIVARTKGG